jgi:hypothetical protein
MVTKFGFSVKFIIISIFIFIINFSFLFSSYILNQAFAQSFIFYSADAAAPVTTGFTFLKNSGGSISYPQIYQGRLRFAETLTLEKPPYIQFTFLSDNYSINSIKTSPEVIKLIKGEAVAVSSSIYKVYLSVKNNSGFSYNSNQTNNINSNTIVNTAANTSGAKFNFGHNPNLPGANSGINQSRPQTQSQTQFQIPQPTQQQKQSQPQAQTRTQIPIQIPAQPLKQTYTNPYSGNKFGGAHSVQNQPPVSPVVVPATPVSTSVITNSGGVSGYITGGSTTFGGGSVIVSVTNGNNQFIKSRIVNTEPDGSVYPYTINGIPPILPGSNDYYKISVTSNNGFQSTQYPQSNIKIYGADQVVQAQPIVMQARRGKLNITLYHGRPALNESEQSLSELARNAVINISGTASSARYSGESPARFYRYTIDDAPAGKRQLSIMFPGHGVSGGSVREVTIPADSSASVLYNLSEGQL